MLGKKMRECLHDGTVVYGTQLTALPSTRTAARLAGAGLDFIFIDTEHIPLDRETVSWMCHYLASRNVCPVVRVAYPSRHLIAMAADAGAQGIVVPYVETEEEVREIVAAARYRPLKGQRVQEHLSGTHLLNEETQAYLNSWNQQAFILAGIESVTAYERLDALMNVPFLDGVFIGPHDLSISLGLPEQYSHPDFLRVVENIFQRARQAGLGAGFHIKPKQVPIERMRKWIRLGLNWFLYSNDADILADTLIDRLGEIRQPETGLAD